MGSPALTLGQCLKLQRAAHRADPYPDLERRRGHLAALHRFLQENEAAIIEAIQADFGVRPATETRLLELFPVRQGIRDATRHLAKWMRSQRRSVDQLIFPGASNRVVPQPLGVVGVLVPWNFPIFLSFGPLVDILAAGNHAMVKMSDRSGHLARLLIEVFPLYLPIEKVAFFEDLGRGPEFSKLPFDHMLFTGSSGVGRAVMASAAANLCPVTLELGGKAPAVVAPDFSLATAAQRILWAKCMNAGQVCVNVDYLLLPEGSIDAFVAHAKRLVAERYPDLNGPDYTTIIDQPAFDRLVATLEDAKVRGATVINLAPDQQLDARRRKLAPHIVLGVTDEMTIMKEEIFGPFLPIKPYREAKEVIAYVNGHDRPLAFYPFTNDKRLAQRYITEILSGSVGVNEAIVQVGQHDLPFGGVGASGIGHYHGFEGFLTFSKLRPIFCQGRVSSIQAFLQPPYGKRAKNVLDWMVRLRG
ncbi:coniferyl aldehyde dehydrogenase [Synechococcus sp. Tobar12-5m-g]|uniref:coniferyl aldehyde dehydrogenase n=1 Tax=unclassified Synechococcus TaxID=2626047 RepID=UPI0020CC69DD|nr:MULTISPECIES: coniferyl aldehyde dehydrogenase [unclassified Synechococcus]MCP9771190.1 coniferyl aldehyde dehydrogenase [Synechococcus sp. Tobar12-5m-g]MCP9872130.1 coniferyl aldehyde dehydrogenase [Synechococcus sp. Cruz CV-v-12]